MTLTPHEIESRVFREQFRGYHQEDVDTFLEEIAEEFGRLGQEGQRMRIQVAALQQEVARLHEAKDVEVSEAVAGVKDQATDEAKSDVRRALVAAQTAAEELLQEARARADALIAEAESRARELGSRASAHARSVDPEAAATIDDLQARIDDLRKQEDEIRTRLRGMLEEHLQVLDQADARTRHDATVERMSRELGDAPPAAEPDPQRFWTEPS